MLFNQVGGLFHDLRVENRVALRVIEGRDGHAPGPLARDAPVRARLDRRFDPVLAPIRYPAYAVDFLEGLLAEGPGFRTRLNRPMVNLDKPLVHRAEDDRGFAAPTMRVTVMIVLLVQQRFGQAQLVQHGLVGFALAVFFQDGFAQHVGGHLLLDREVVCVRELPVIVHR